MENKKKKILVLTSVDPSHGPAIVAEDFYKILKRNGYEVDFLSPFPVKNHPEYLYVYKNKIKQFLTPTYLLRKLTDNNRIVKLFRKRVEGHYFFYRRETQPPMSVNDILRSIKKKYDIVCVYFWQGMLTFQTIEAIYEKLHCLIFFVCVDYSPMSGGCHFTRDCKNYMIGCGNCPGIGSKKLNDFTRFNVEYRKRVYEKVHPVVTGNGYMHTFYDESYLLKDYDRKMKKYFLLDLEEYSQRDRSKAREKYSIPDSKSFVIFWGAQGLDDPRKGISYLLRALTNLYKKFADEDKGRVLLLIAGRNIEAIKEQIAFDYKHLGYVNPKELPEIYSMADVFLSPSIDDAGPSMVNQSLACGTPVVSFEMGTALDYVKGRNTGYCAKLKDVDDFAHGIEMIFQMSPSEYEKMRLECRRVSEELSSESSFIKRFDEVVEMYANEN